MGRRLAADETFAPARDWAWHTDAEGKTCAYVSRDATAVPQQGPGAAQADGRRDGYLRVLDLARQAATTPKGRRDLTLLRLLHDLAPRRVEVLALDLEDADLEASTVRVLGKGRTAKVPITLPGQARAALADWLAVREQEPGPVFLRVDGTGKGSRLTGDGLWKIVRDLVRRAGLSRARRPHGLRHQGSRWPWT